MRPPHRRRNDGMQPSKQVAESREHSNEAAVSPRGRLRECHGVAASMKPRANPLKDTDLHDRVVLRNGASMRPGGEPPGTTMITLKPPGASAGFNEAAAETPERHLRRGAHGRSTTIHRAGARGTHPIGRRTGPHCYAPTDQTERRRARRRSQESSAGTTAAPHGMIAAGALLQPSGGRSPRTLNAREPEDRLFSGACELQRRKSAATGVAIW